MSSEIRAGLGFKALGRPLVRKVLARERERETLVREILAGVELGLEPLGSEMLGMKAAGFGGADQRGDGNYSRVNLGIRQESGKS